MKGVDVTMQITCLESDVEAVKQELSAWFCDSDTAMVQRSRTGGIKVSAPCKLQPWMREALGLGPRGRVME